MSIDIAGIARILDQAERTARATEQLDGELPLDDAYAIQHAIRDRHLERGETYIGPKLGFTSKAKMEQMGVSDIIVGFLTDAMQVPAGQPLALDGLIHPRIEPELVFRLRDEVVVTPDEDPQALAGRIRAAVDAVAVGFEVIDSRYRDFRFSLSDVVADNTSAARFIVGPWQPLPASLSGRAVELIIDDQVVEQGATDAILGDPFEALSQLASMASRYRIPLPAGATVLAGSMTAAQWLAPGQRIQARVEGFEPLETEVAGERPQP